MKKLMLGNEAAARGLYEAGCALCFQLSRHPQHGDHRAGRSNMTRSTASGRPTRRSPWRSPSARPWPASAAPACMKHVGLNVAADPLFTIAYTGVNAGMVIWRGRRPGNALLPERAGLPPLRRLPPRSPCWNRRTPPECQGLCQAGLRAVRGIRHPRLSEALHPHRPLPEHPGAAASVWSRPGGPMRRTSPNTSWSAGNARAPPPHRGGAHPRA